MARRSAELRELQENFRLAVVFGGDPDAQALPCWYGTEIEDTSKCEGRIIAGHFIKQTRIDNALFAQGLSLRERWQAIWDPDLAVPSCKGHDDRWDGHQTPPLVIWRHQVPWHVEKGVARWGLLTALEDRCRVRA
jgi:hypothetical protein